MNTINAFEKDIFFQIGFLEDFKPQKALTFLQQKKTIFCGTGDSYVAALLGESFSNYAIRAADPLDLIKNPTIPKNSHLYLISISGNTVSNVKCCNLGKKSTAITANKKSKLAKECNKIIELKYKSAGLFTSGSVGFLASALTCISLASKIRIPNTKNMFFLAETISKNVKLSGRIYIIGNLHTYPIAMYAAAKLYEILGVSAQYEKIEQFSHMGLFSVKENDTVIILEQTNSYNLQLSKNLKKLGLNVIQADPQTTNKISQVLFYIFLSQLIPLNIAKEKKQKECYFVTAKKIRDVSSGMIY